MKHAHLLQFAAVAGLLAVQAIKASAQSPFDSITVLHQRACQMPCIDYRITLTPAGLARVDRSDGVAITLTLPAPAAAALAGQFRHVGIDSVRGQVPARSGECGITVDHSPTIVIGVFVGGGQRNIRDEHFCSLNRDVVGPAEADRVTRLHDFEAALDRAVGIDRWLVP